MILYNINVFLCFIHCFISQLFFTTLYLKIYPRVFNTIFHLKSYICCERILYYIPFSLSFSPFLFPFLLFISSFLLFPINFAILVFCLPFPFTFFIILSLLHGSFFCCTPVVLKWKRFCPQVIFGKVCRYFGCHPWNEGWP